MRNRVQAIQISGTQYPGVSAGQAICVAPQSSGIQVLNRPGAQRPSTSGSSTQVPGSLLPWHFKVEVSGFSSHRGKLFWVEGAIGAEQAIRVVDKPRPRNCFHEDPTNFLFQFSQGMIALAGAK